MKKLKQLSPNSSVEYIVGWPHREPDHHPSTERYSCVECHGDCFISPTGSERIRKDRCKVICCTCFDRRMKRPEFRKETEVFVPSRADLAKDYGDGVADLITSLYAGARKKKVRQT